MAEVDIEVRLRAAKSINDFKELSKEFTKMASGIDGNSAAFKRFAEGARQANNEVDRLKNSMRTDAANAFRTFYKEQRIGDKVMGDASKTLQSFTNILGGTEISNAFNTVVNNFQSLEFGIKGASVAAEGAGGKMATFGSVLNSVAVPLALVGGGIMFAVNQMNELEAASDAAGKALANAMNQAALNKMGDDSKKKYEYYRRMRDEAEKKMKEKQRLYMGAEARSGDWSAMGRYMGAGAEKYRAEYKDAASEFVSWQDKMDQSGYSPLGTPAPVPDVVYPEEKAAKDEGINRYYSSEYFKTKYRTRESIGKLGGAGIGRRDVGIGQIKMGVQEIDKVETKVEGINENVKTIGTTLANSLTEGFMRGFETGDNMLKTFAQSVLSSIMGIAAQQAAIAGISGILSLIPGVGTFSTIGKALGSIFANTSSGSSASPITGVDATNGRAGVSQELRGIKSAVQNLELRVDNQGMYMASERGRVAFERA